jgi:hypothetical protein
MLQILMPSVYQPASGYLRHKGTWRILREDGHFKICLKKQKLLVGWFPSACLLCTWFFFAQPLFF